MNGLNVLVLSVDRRQQSFLAGIFEGFGHEVTDVFTVFGNGDASSEQWDIVVVDAADCAVDRQDIARIRSRFSRPVLVIGERPMCLSGIDGAMFSFADASEQGHELALRMCLALSPLVSCERVPQPALASPESLGTLLSPDRWLERPTADDAARRRIVPA